MGSLIRFCFAALMLSAFGGACWAQQASITGSVHDVTGAVIPNATVTVTSDQQGFSREVTSNATGDYLVPGLPAGTYNITVKAPGFQQFVVKGLTLRVSDKARADASLTVGQSSTEVTVAGTDVAQVQTETAELSATITTKQINQLVLKRPQFYSAHHAESRRQQPDRPG